jgi:hypothetical protein
MCADLVGVEDAAQQRGAVKLNFLNVLLQCGHVTISRRRVCHVHGERIGIAGK